MVERCGKSGKPVQPRHITQSVFLCKLEHYNFVVSGLSGLSPYFLKLFIEMCGEI